MFNDNDIVGLQRTLNLSRDKDIEIKFNLKLVEKLQAEQDSVTGSKTDIQKDLYFERQQIFAFKRMLGLPSEVKNRQQVLSALQKSNLNKDQKKKTKRISKKKVVRKVDIAIRSPTPSPERSETSKLLQISGVETSTIVKGIMKQENDLNRSRSSNTTKSGRSNSPADKSSRQSFLSDKVFNER